MNDRRNTGDENTSYNFFFAYFSTHTSVLGLVRQEHIERIHVRTDYWFKKSLNSWSPIVNPTNAKVSIEYMVSLCLSTAYRAYYFFSFYVFSSIDDKSRKKWQIEKLGWRQTLPFSLSLSETRNKEEKKLKRSRHQGMNSVCVCMVALENTTDCIEQCG